MQNIKNTEPDPYTSNITANFVVHYNSWDALDFNYRLYGTEMLQVASKHINAPKDKTLELSIMLSNDSKLQELNNYFRGFDKPTNVLSFPYGGGEEEYYIGDIAISYETIYKEAQEQKKELQHHFAHMLLHGFLHLMGYDHIEDEERNEMEALEIAILKNFNISNPYI